MRKIFHVVEQHPTLDPRILRARRSWSTIYARGGMIPIHVKDFKPTARDIGDKRDLPLLRTILEKGRAAASNDDLIVITNSDNTLHPKLPELLQSLSTPAVCSFRLNTTGPVSLSTTPEVLATRYRPDYGRDLFAFTVPWLDEHWKDIPNCYLGEWEFDLLLALMIRASLGIVTKTTQDFHLLTAAELPLGYVLHEKHDPAWMKPANLASPAKEWNKAIARAWYEDHGLAHLYTLGE